MFVEEHCTKFFELKPGRLKFCNVQLLSTKVEHFAEILNFESMVRELGSLFRMGKVVRAMLLGELNILVSHSFSSFIQVATPGEGGAIWHILSPDSLCCLGISSEISFGTSIF